MSLHDREPVALLDAVDLELMAAAHHRKRCRGKLLNRFPAARSWSALPDKHAVLLEQRSECLRIERFRASK
jgi:hypothetical protein